MSDDLIADLASNLRPVRGNAVRRGIGFALAAGGLLSAAIMLVWLGLRPDLSRAVFTPVFWTKFGFTLALAVAGLMAVHRLARPGGSLRRPISGAFAVIALAGAAAVVQLLTSGPEDVRRLVLGGTALVCPFYITALGLPVFLAVIGILRQFAPTNLPAAGFAAGLLGGAVGAWIYAFHCGESGLPFVTLWYTMGVLAVAIIGAATGRWLLRW